MPRTFLVTGGAGFIGSYVVRRLLADGHTVCVYDSFVVYAPADPHSAPLNFLDRLRDVADRVRILRGSTLDKDFLRRKLVELKPDGVIHMGAMPLAALALEHTEEAFQSIVTSTHNILEILRDLPHPCRMTYVSSSMVYGDFQTAEVTEEHPTNPKDVYGAFKLAGEVIVNAYGKNYGLDTVICRPSAVYGPYDANNRVVQKFIRRALAGQPLPVDGDGSMRLDFTYVEDTAAAIALAATAPAAKGQTFNVTRGEGRSLRELSDLVCAAIPGTRLEHREAPSFMPKRGTLSVERARKVLGYKPVVTLEEGVRRYVAHLRAHPF